MKKPRTKTNNTKKKTYSPHNNQKPVFKKKASEPRVDDGTIRLNKYISNAGISSRREADELIKSGLAQVNGVVITEMGYRVQPNDEVRFDNKKISPEKKVYLVLNKPKGFMTTSKDDNEGKTVMNLISSASPYKLFPIGKLDRQNTGVLLFSNDGHLVKKLNSEDYISKKIYHVLLEKKLHGDDLIKIKEGVRLHEGIVKVDSISFIEGKHRNEIGIEISIGWENVIKRVFEAVGYKVDKMDRVSFAGLTKKNLKRGQWRILTEKEVGFLKMK